jgi:hypothetical protein
MSCWSRGLHCRSSRYARSSRFCCRRSHARLWRRCGCGRSHSRSFRCGFLRLFLCFGSRFRLSFGFCDSLNLLSYFIGDVDGNRARVRLFFGNTKAGQKVNDGFGLDLQFAC